MTSLAQVGLALATSIGAWINFALVVWFAAARRFHQLRCRDSSARFVKLALAGLALFVVLWIAQWPVRRFRRHCPRTTGRRWSCSPFSVRWSTARAIFGLFGKSWLASFWRMPPG